MTITNIFNFTIAPCKNIPPLKTKICALISKAFVISLLLKDIPAIAPVVLLKLPLIAPEAVAPTKPISAPPVRVATPSVKEPPVTAPVTVKAFVQSQMQDQKNQLEPPELN